MNELDSEVIAGMLTERGLVAVAEEEADLLIFNTCSIRDLAERKAMGKIGKLKQRKGGDQIIGVTGCMANAKKGSLFEKLPHIDFVLGTSDIHALNVVLDEVIATGRPVIRTSSVFTYEIDYLTARRDDPVKAHISIIRGCNKFCTYCVVPYTRGPEVSRDPKEIVEECYRLVERGYKEVTLLGQNVNSYGKDRPEWGVRFHDLLYLLDKVPGLARIRFMTSHPVDITTELMVAVRDLPSVCEFVHFPIQSGSDRILRKMHRMYTKAEYLEKVVRFREILPSVSLGTDIIVGFPTETEEEFRETYMVLKELEYSVAFLFTYSARKGTPAMRFRDDIPEAVKKERLHTLQELQKEISQKQREAMLGKSVEVLVESQNFKDTSLLKGRTRCWKNVLFSGASSLIGTLQSVVLTGFSHQTFFGKLL